MLHYSDSSRPLAPAFTEAKPPAGRITRSLMRMAAIVYTLSCADEEASRNLSRAFLGFLLIRRLHTGESFPLTNAFSKKVESHSAAVALYFVYCNFGRIYQILRVTPAMVAGVATRGWSAEEIVGLP